MQDVVRYLVGGAIAALATVSGAAEFQVGPPPGWVEPVAADLSHEPGADARGGLEYLLVDDQVRIGGGPAQRYHHVVRRVLSPKGVESGAEVRIEFDPSYQQLQLHRVTIHRGRSQLDALRPGDVKLIQRERELERRLFDGAFTAVLFLRDVRPGDVIETAWTVSGENPVFDGRWMGTAALAYAVPVEVLEYRLVAPAGRVVSWRAQGVELAPRVTRRGETTEYLWRRSHLPATLAEGELPPGLDPFAWLELSEWPDWAAVVKWALPLYAADPPSAELRERIGEWRTMTDPAARVLAALRFVQDEIRYLGIELGARSHRPHPPAEVLARRFGDCKDKALLLVTALRALGVDAAPALVNTGDRGAVDARLPSPFAFDHVIVRAVIGGRVHWLEPTRSLEHGALAALVPPPYGRALVIAPGERGLTALPEPVPSPLRVDTTLRVARFGAPAELEIATTSEGLRAVDMRHTLAERTATHLQRQYLEFYARRYPGIVAAGPLEVVDARDADRVMVRERYVLGAIGAGDEGTFAADAIAEAVRSPENALRTLPLRVAHPVTIDERIRVELPGPPALAADVRRVNGKAAVLSRVTRLDGNAYVVDLAYRSRAPAVDPGAMTEHLAALREMRGLAHFGLTLAVAGAGESGRGDTGLAIAIAALVVGVIGVLAALTRGIGGDPRGWWRELGNRRRQQAFRARFRTQVGESPAAPMVVRAHEGMGPAVARLRCSCGGALGGPSGEPETVRYGGSELCVHRLGCTRCDEVRPVYFVRAGASEGGAGPEAGQAG